MWWFLDSSFLMVLFFLHVFRSNRLYVTYHWLFEFRGCIRVVMWLSVTRITYAWSWLLYSLVKLEKLRVFSWGIFPAFIRNKTEDRNYETSKDQVRPWTSRPSVGRPCAKRGIRAWSMVISMVIGIVSGWSNRGLQCGVSSHLLKGQFDSLVMSAEHNSCLAPACTTSL